MGIPVVQNTQTNSGTNVSSVVITKPTSLAVGDLMVAFIGYYRAGSSTTITTPSGWDSRQKDDGSDTGQACFTRIATSGDVAASDFTFQVGASSDIVLGSLHRIDGYSSIGTSEIDSLSTDADGDLSFTTSLTPTVSNNLLIASYCGADPTWSGTPSASTYSSTPSKTWSEKADVGAKSSNLGLLMSVATADNTNTDQVTGRTALMNDAPTAGVSSIILIVEGTVDATGTNALLAVSPTFFTQNGVAGATGTNTLHAPSPTFFDQSGYGNSPTQWANPNKESTTWTNPDKP